MQQEDEQKRNDAIDFVISGMQKVSEVRQSDGTTKQQTEFDHETAWYKGHMINRPFGRCALFIKRLEHVAMMCEDFMSKARAENIKKNILLVVDEYKRSIDAKSSETYLDDNNSQSNLMHLLSQNKTERKITLKEDAKKSMLDGFLGKDKNKDE